MRIDWKSCFRLIVSVLIIYFCIQYWNQGMSLIGAFFSSLTSFILGGVIAYAVNILMSFLERYYREALEYTWIKSMYRPVCMVLSYIILALILVALTALIVPELINCVRMIIEGLPAMLEQAAANEDLKELLPMLAEQTNMNMDALAGGQAEEIVSLGFMGILGKLTTSFAGILSGIVTYFMAFVFSIYFLLDKDRLKDFGRQILKRYLDTEDFHKYMHILTVLNQNTRSFIVGQCFEAVILGTLCIILMFVFRLPYALMIGVLVGFTALIPVVGAYIGGIVGFLMILTVSPGKALFFVVFIIVLQQLEGNLIYPKVVGESIGLPALWVLAAVSVGGGVAGVTGMLIAVPLAASAFQLLEEDLQNTPGQS